MTTKPNTRKAAQKKMPGQAVIDAHDVLAEAAKLTNAVRLIALELDEYECGAICSVADSIKAKIGDAIALIERRDCE